MAKNSLTPEESALFRQAAGTVQPVVSDKADLRNLRKPKPYPKKQELTLEARLDYGITPDEGRLSIEDAVAHHVPGMQKSVLKKLRRGLFGIDAELDLHGLTSAQAKDRLLHFLQHCVEAGLRCVHIIHGKGYRSPDLQPVLKNDLNLWLRQHRDVLAFCTSPPRDGGAGAVYVLLRLAEKFGRDEALE